MLFLRTIDVLAPRARSLAAREGSRAVKAEKLRETAVAIACRVPFTAIEPP